MKEPNWDKMDDKDKRIFVEDWCKDMSTDTHEFSDEQFWTFFEMTIIIFNNIQKSR